MWAALTRLAQGQGHSQGGQSRGGEKVSHLIRMERREKEEGGGENPRAGRKKPHCSIHVAFTSPLASEASPESRPSSSLQSQAVLAPGRLLSSSSLLLGSATYCRVQGMTKRRSLVSSIPSMLGGSP